MCYGNLRGIREAGKSFALPTYLFTGSVGLMIVVGLAREAVTGLHRAPLEAGAYCNGCHGHPGTSLLNVLVIFALARAFANGGSSLTGIEAVSNAVSALQPPEGRNARQVLVTQGSIVIFLIAGISWLAHVTHATPYTSGVPTVLAQEASLVFGHTVLGRVLFYAVQAGTATILFTGGNTSFSGFPFLASFVAEDSFLPRWLTKRGHRLVFSSGIIVLTVLALSLLIAVGANTNNLIPFYAIGVFTGFTMAGFGMARYHRRNRGPGWRHHTAISLIGAFYAGLVVLIQAVFKFTEGAWLVIVIFPLLVFTFIRLNRQYRMEAQVLERIGARAKPTEPPTYSRRTVFVFVDEYDLATIAALRYARSLRPTTLRAVHFVIDNIQSETLRQDWVRANTGIVLDFVDCADRRLAGTRERRGRPARGGGHRDPAAAWLFTATWQAAARPHSGQDRRRSESDPARRGHDRAVRRSEPVADDPGAPGRTRRQDARTRRQGTRSRRQDARSRRGRAGACRAGRRRPRRGG